MCFNPKISIITYFIGLLGSLLLWRSNHKPEAIFYTWVIQMQLIEYLIWNNLKCDSINNYITKSGIIINHMEPIILWLGIIIFSRLKLNNYIHSLMLIYIIWAIIYTKNVFDSSCTTVTDESKPHLHWLWNNGNNASLFYTYFLFIFVILSIYGLENGYIHAIMCILSFGISYKIYGDKHAVGAMWCFAAAFAPIILYYIYQSQ